MSARTRVVLLAINIRVNSDNIVPTGALVGSRETRALRRNVDYRNVCFPIERLSEPNDAFRTRVRAHTYNVWTAGAIVPEGWGRAHCVPLIPRYTLDKLANDYRLREMHFLAPFASRSA